MPPTLEQTKWVQDNLQVIKLTDHEEVEDLKRKDALRGEIAQGEKQVDTYIVSMAAAVTGFYEAYRQGLDTFGRAMLDAEAEKEDTATMASIAFKVFLGLVGAAFPEVALAKKLGQTLGERLGEKAGEKLGEKAAAALKEITLGALEKGKESLKAPEPNVRQFRAFAKDLGDASIPSQRAMAEAVGLGGISVKAVYAQMAMQAGTTDGDAAQYLKLMQAAAKTFTNWMNASADPNKLEEKFATEFAGKKGQTPKRGSLLDSTRDTGTLYFEITAVTNMRSPDPKFYLGDDTDKKWKLVMLGNEKDAQGAARALKESAGAPWKIAMPRKIRLDLYNEANKKDHKMCSGWMVFKIGNTSAKPDNYEELRGSYWGGETGKSPQAWLELAWSHGSIRAAAIANDEIEGVVD